MATLGYAEIPVPAGGQSPTVPAHLAALAEAIDPHLRQTATDLADRTTKYATAPAHTLVTANDGTMWLKTSSVADTWVTIWEPLPTWDLTLTLASGFQEGDVEIGLMIVDGGRKVELKGRIEKTDATKITNPNAVNLGSVPNDCIPPAATFQPTGVGAVCFRAVEGSAFAAAEAEIVAVLDNDDDPDLERHVDDYGFTWLVARQDDVSALVTDLHAVNTALEAQGFGPQLLCSLVSFKDSTGRTLALVYLYKQGTFYPFAPQPGEGQRRDNLLEMQVRDLVKNDLPVEADLQKWMPVWGAPGL